MWATIKSSISHQVSRFGDVRSIDRYINHWRGGTRLIKGRINKKYIDRAGYYRTAVIVGGKQKSFWVHKLVAESFLHIPPHKVEVNHKNGNKLDNRVENLEWITHKENIRHSFDVLGRVGPMLGKYGKSHNNSKAVTQYTRDNILIKEWGSISDIKRELGYNIGNICQCCKLNKNYSHAFGFVWRYKDRINEL